jgi:hypothetical protein
MNDHYQYNLQPIDVHARITNVFQGGDRGRMLSKGDKCLGAQGLNVKTLQ